jgi:thiamine-monophosphate kinase
MKLSQIGELKLINILKRKFSKFPKDIIVGIGDDSAVIKTNKKKLLITSDMLVEGIHFDLSYTTPHQLGFKLITVNVSDIYAMGGKPTHFLINLSLKKDTEKKFFEDFFNGIQKAMIHYRVNLIGGDISSTLKNISLSATMLGYSDKVIRRNGAKIGDKIYVSGYLGDSACGLKILNTFKKPLLSDSGKLKDEYKKLIKTKFNSSSLPDVEYLIRRHLMPVADNSGVNIKKITSMIDISDGLLIDLSRLCDESKTGARIFLDRVPLSNELLRISNLLKIPAIKIALTGGEDYRLLLTSPTKINAYCIGEIIKSGKELIDKNGRKINFSAVGYQHFKK